MPTLAASGIGSVEFNTIVSSEVVHLADPAPSVSKKRKKRGNYIQYTTEQHASIDKYAVENVKERARRHFHYTFPYSSESTIRNFKKAYRVITE